MFTLLGQGQAAGLLCTVDLVVHLLLQFSPCVSGTAVLLKAATDEHMHERI